MSLWSTDHIRFHYYDEDGSPTDAFYDPEFMQLTDRLLDESELEEIVASRNIPQPKWFKQSYQEAHAFLASLALGPMPAAYIIEDLTAPLPGASEPSEPRTYAYHYAFPNVILVDEESVKEFYAAGGSAAVSKLLVHEGAHGSEGLVDVDIGIENDEINYSFRCGFSRNENGHTSGTFPEEGIANHAEGWFARSRNDPLAPPVAVSEPLVDLPDYYKLPETKFQSWDDQRYGSSGYGMELVGFGLERKGIMPASTYIAIAYETRRPDSRQKSLVEHHLAVNALQPGLYEALEELPFTTDAHCEGLELILEAVRS